MKHRPVLSNFCSLACQNFSQSQGSAIVCLTLQYGWVLVSKLSPKGVLRPTTVTPSVQVSNVSVKLFEVKKY